METNDEKKARVTFEQPEKKDMDIHAPKGTKVIYTGENGYPADKEYADKYLKKGEVYTIDFTDVHSWYTRVYLKEVPGKNFNSVHFVQSYKKEDFDRFLMLPSEDRDSATYVAKCLDIAIQYIEESRKQQKA